MVKCCFVPSCTTGSAVYVKQQKASGLKYKSLFKPPKNPELLAKWIKAIPRKDKVLSKSSFVCELHFEDNDVLFYDKTILLDGTVDIIKRIRPILRTGAVPCIFPNVPNNLTEHNDNRILPAKGPIYIDRNKCKPQNKPKKSLACSNKNEMQCSENINQQFSFQYLKENLDQLEKPDSKWMFESKDDEVVLVRWSCFSSKKITISNGLVIKIFFNDIEILLDHIINKILLSINETNELLKHIHSLIDCKGIMITENNITRRSITCKGYVERRPKQRGPKSSYCFDCRVARKNMADSLRKKLSNFDYNIQEN